MRNQIVQDLWKKALVKESFLPLENARLRLPAGKSAPSATLLWRGSGAPVRVRHGGAELTAPQARICEAIRVDLG